MDDQQAERIKAQLPPPQLPDFGGEGSIEIEIVSENDAPTRQLPDGTTVKVGVTRAQLLDIQARTGEARIPNVVHGGYVVIDLSKVPDGSRVIVRGRPKDRQSVKMTKERLLEIAPTVFPNGIPADIRKAYGV